MENAHKYFRRVSFTVTSFGMLFFFLYVNKTSYPDANPTAVFLNISDNNIYYLSWVCRNETPRTFTGFRENKEILTIETFKCDKRRAFLFWITEDGYVHWGEVFNSRIKCSEMKIENITSSSLFTPSLHVPDNYTVNIEIMSEFQLAFVSYPDKSMIEVYKIEIIDRCDALSLKKISFFTTNTLDDIALDRGIHILLWHSLKTREICMRDFDFYGTLSDSVCLTTPNQIAPKWLLPNPDKYYITWAALNGSLYNSFYYSKKFTPPKLSWNSNGFNLNRLYYDGKEYFTYQCNERNVTSDWPLSSLVKEDQCLGKLAFLNEMLSRWEKSAVNRQFFRETLLILIFSGIFIFFLGCMCFYPFRKVKHDRYFHITNERLLMIEYQAMCMHFLGHLPIPINQEEIEEVTEETEEETAL